eukprot:2195478-Pleurochrysis_carterae.AAC.1
MQRSPFCRCLLRRSGLRRALLAINTRALVDIAAGTSEDVGAFAGTGEEGTSVTVAPKRGDCTSRRYSRPAIILGAENATSKITSWTMKSNSSTIRARNREERNARSGA